jgi:hypothetical protein
VKEGPAERRGFFFGGPRVRIGNSPEGHSLIFADGCAGRIKVNKWFKLPLEV